MVIDVLAGFFEGHAVHFKGHPDTLLQRKELRVAQPFLEFGFTCEDKGNLVERIEIEVDHAFDADQSGIGQLLGIVDDDNRLFSLIGYALGSIFKPPRMTLYSSPSEILVDGKYTGLC